MLSPQKSAFSLPPDVCYLNAARLSPLSKKVEAAGMEGMLLKRQPWKITAHHFFEQIEVLRKLFAQLINCPYPERIVSAPAVSYGMANVSANLQLKPMHEIIVLSGQFPSNYYPWWELAKRSGARLKVVEPPVTSGKNKTEAWNQALLEAIDHRTKLVAMPQLHWTDGTLFDLVAVREATRKHRCLLVVDGTQSVGAYPFDFAKIQPDVLVCAGYKWLMGPYGTGLAYYGPAFDQGKPIEEAWINREMSDDFTALLNYQEEYRQGAQRYEAGGRSNFISIPMLAAGIAQIMEWGVPNIAEYCSAISKATIAHIRDAGFEVSGDHHDKRAGHLFGIRFPHGFDVAALKQLLDERAIKVSFRGDAMRVSPYVYNTPEDLAQLAEALFEIQKASV